MTVLVTTGPSYEPIDEVRRLTNFSTGELGIRLANRLAQAGFEVGCLRAVGTTYPGPLDGPRLLPFTTNQDLLDRMTSLRDQHPIMAVFHVAALCDFLVTRVTDASGVSRNEAKLDSRSQGLILHLQPAVKVIHSLRALFPEALIVGWKYELTGERADALQRAWHQIRENRTDACVLNGRAYGPGFAVCSPPDQVVELADKEAVTQFLANWLTDRRRQ